MDGSDPGSPSNSGTPQPSEKASGKPAYAKRGKITIVACVPCRKRKTKCDGKRPKCGQCTARYDGCHYDMTDDQRKLTYLRDRSDKLEQQQYSLEGLIDLLRQSHEDDAQRVLARIRAGESAKTLSDEFRAGRFHADEAHAQHDSNVTDNEYTQGALHLSPERAQARVVRYERLIELISTCSLAFVQSIVERLRKDEDVFAILNSMDASSHPFESLEYDDGHALNGLQMSQGSPMYALPGKSQQATIYTAEDNIPQTRPWNESVQDGELIDHLLELYFTWQHSFFQSFVQELFQEDYINHRTKHCSSALVNAICACGCFLSGREQLRLDCASEQQYASSFFDEAMSHLNSALEPSVPNTAAMYLVSYVEGYRGNRSSQWVLSGRSALMALDLRLHLPSPKPTNPDLNAMRDAADEALARTHSFWGCFHVMQCNSLMLERVPIFQNSSILVELPEIDDEDDQRFWKSYELAITKRPGARSTTFRKCAELSQVINTTQQLFYAPTENLTGSRLVDQYERYQFWYDALPQMVQIMDDDTSAPPPPHVICLHLYYHSAIVLLFRPFLGFKLNGSGIIPRDICHEAAKTISRLWTLHRKLFGRSGIWQFQVNCLLIASTIHILYLPDPESTQHLIDSCRTFQELQTWQGWAHEALVMLRYRVNESKMQLPAALSQALFHQDDSYQHRDRSQSSTRQMPTPVSLTPGSQTGMSSFQENYAGSPQRLPQLRSQQFGQQVGQQQSSLQYRATSQQTPKRHSATSKSDKMAATAAASQPKRARVDAPVNARGSGSQSYPTSQQRDSATMYNPGRSMQQGLNRLQPSSMGSSSGLYSDQPRVSMSQGVSPASYMYNIPPTGQAPMLYTANFTQQQARMGQVATQQMPQQQHGFIPDPSVHRQQPSGSSNQSMTGTASTSSTDDTALHGGVEGLSFAEDWRNPYLTFMHPQQQNPPGDNDTGQQ